jgi:diadenylate cyclase
VQQALWLLSKLSPLAVFDILLVTLIVYGLLMLIRGTQADQLVRGVLMLLLASAVVGYFFKLTIFTWLLQNTIPALLIAIPVIFQPELRRALEHLGRTGSIINYPLHLHLATSVEKLAGELARASAMLAEREYGGLMVIERTTGLEEYVQTGTRIDGTVTAELLLQIFYKGSPLHDGAVIIRGDRIIAARCLLPLTEETGLDPELGTRHRAAIGVTESTDAICIVVSEETGAISLANHGHLVRQLNEQKLRLLLTALLQAPVGIPGMERVPGLPGWRAAPGAASTVSAAVPPTAGADGKTDGMHPAGDEVGVAPGAVAAATGAGATSNGRHWSLSDLGRRVSRALGSGRRGNRRPRRWRGRSGRPRVTGRR